MATTVELSKHALKQLRKAPASVQKKLVYWVETVITVGLEETRKISGFHDEPLWGIKKGRRSIRLNKQWRAEYSLVNDENGKLIVVLEVHPHDY